MADKTTGGKSREEIAFELLKLVSAQEGKDVTVAGSGADRTYILATYWACLKAQLYDPAEK